MNFLPEGTNFNKDITYLAKTNFRAQRQVFGIKRRDRRQHMYVLGKSGTGKSVLLQNMIVQNIWNGEGVAVVDPHGELVETIISTIPPHRVKDVIYFNPADHDFHIGFNVLQIDDTRYKHLVASGLMGIFTKIWANAWSARMEYILNNAILALLDTPGSTLLGIPRLLVDKDYRQTIVNNLKDPVIKAFWVHEYETWRDQYRNEAIAPIQNKVGQFLSTSIVRNVVGQAKSTIDLFAAMNEGKIFLVNVSKGRIGEDNSALLGGMLITKLQLAAMERVRIPEEERRDFFLYVDEFQNFVTDSFASILSEARKYRLNLTIAHQYVAQLVTKESSNVRDAVFGNVGTMIIFRIGAEDADFLEKEFEPEFMVEDMVNLPNYNAYLKLMVDGVTSRPFSALTLPPIKIPADSNVAEQIIESSRKLYTRPREEVEKEISQWSGVVSNTNETEGKFKAVCSLCGKETTVPFEPEPGRPVYCKECIAKIKAGELKPLKGTKGKDLTPQSFSALANLGIEFAPAPGSVPPPAAPRKKPVAPSFSPSPRPAAPARSPLSIFKRSETPRPAAANTSPVQTVPTARPAVSASRPAMPVAPARRPAMPMTHAAGTKTARPLENEGLKSILKQALDGALKKGEEFQQKKDAEIQPIAEPIALKKEEKKTISLSSLKKADLPVSNGAVSSPFGSKTASEGKLSALQAAIARAQSPNVKPAVPDAEQPSAPVAVTEVSTPVVKKETTAAPVQAQTPIATVFTPAKQPEKKKSEPFSFVPPVITVAPAPAVEKETAAPAPEAKKQTNPEPQKTETAQPKQENQDRKSVV